MELNYENPEQEQTFPRLYGFDSSKKSNESDISGDESTKHSKKELLIGKRKDKESKKDRGYAALEGESSPEEQETKSPLKSKKSKSFKFASKSKEKREKSREKDVKDKEKEKRSDKSKDKPKSEKKERRKNEASDISETLPIFGVSLELAVERCGCHDGVLLPLPVRECIDYIEEHIKTTEYLYKTSSVKSKVLQVKQMYNQRQTINWTDFDVTTATGLLKSFIRELPNPILTNELLPKFEEASAIQNPVQGEAEFKALIKQLSECNRTLLAWLMIHLENIISHDKYTKMNAQCIAVTLSSVLLMSQRLIAAFLFHSKALFPDVLITKYKPPMTAVAVNLLTNVDEISQELQKQESLLSQIHHDMNAGFISKEREELLWEVQRIITQLKRKLRSVQKYQDQTQESIDEPKTAIAESEPIAASSQVVTTSKNSSETNETETKAVVETVESRIETNSSEESPPEPNSSTNIQRPLLSDEDKNILLLQFQNSELIELQTYLLSQIQIEMNEVIQLRKKLLVFDENTTSTPIVEDSHEWDIITNLLVQENQMLNIKKNNLIRELMEQREECVNLQSQLLYIALSQG